MGSRVKFLDVWSKKRHGYSLLDHPYDCIHCKREYTAEERTIAILQFIGAGGRFN